MTRHFARRLFLPFALLLAISALMTTPSAAVAEGALAVEPDWLDFGTVWDEDQVNDSVTVRNVGSDSVTIGPISFDGDPGPFSVLPGSCSEGLSLNVGASCGIGVAFTAPSKTTGVFDATMAVEGSGGDSASTLLTGSSYAAGFLSAPAAINFTRNLADAPPPPVDVRIQNSGNTAVTIWSTGVVGLFGLVANQCTGVLDAGADCMVTLRFVNGRAPRVEGALTIETLELGRGVSVLLTGLTMPIPKRSLYKPPVDYGTVEADLARLAEAVPGLIKGGPSRARKLPTFAGVATGRLGLRVYGRARGRRVPITTASAEIAKGQSHRLRFSLTKRGKRLLRRGTATRVKAIVSFRPTGTTLNFKQAPEFLIRPRRQKQAAG
jgi:hypothetical protein